jgi:hypothetical protein
MTHTRKNRNTHNKTKKHVFSKKDYNSGDGMLTSVWGPPMWHYLHTMSFNYPVNPTQQDKKHYSDFVTNLQYVLPCKYCRMNLSNNFKKKPLQMCHMENRDTFSRYVYDLHEIVNKMLHKKSQLSYCDVREDMNILGQDALKKNQKYSILNRRLLEERKKKVAQSHYMVKNLNALLILYLKRIREQH